VTSDLGSALSVLTEVAATAGLDSRQAWQEGAALAAAVAESAPRAAADWCRLVPSEAPAGTQDFFDSAARGRRWRAAPTRLLGELVATGSGQAEAYARALADVASAACGLGEPTMRVVGNASVAAAAQLAAVAHPAVGHLQPNSGAKGARSPQVSPKVEGQAVEGQAGEGQAGEVPAKGVDELLAELDGLIGLTAVKREVHQQSAVLRVDRLRAEQGLKKPDITRHLVFTGNPGTGKTTVARLVCGIYAALGLLSKGHLVEVDRSELVAGYLGQTATRTSDVVQQAIGGVLFIDEAYSLRGDQYGTEAVDTLVKEMEDHRADLVVIVAGYPEPMAEFVETNPGLASRFRTTIHFTDYTDEELTGIFCGLATAADYEATPATVERFREILAAAPRGPGFGNGRYARNVLESAVGRLAWRLRDVEAPTRDDLRLLLPHDLDPPSPHLDPPSPHLDPPPVPDSPLAETLADPTPQKLEGGGGNR
jgi:hypothetical protein